MREAVNYNEFLADLAHEKLAGCARTLDFGAGNGLFAELMMERGHTVICLEPEPALQEVLAGAGFEVCGDLHDLRPESFDGIYSLNVLEHIDDDAGTVVSLSRLLKPGGSLFVYVPAFEILYSAMDAKVGHLRRYRRATLLATCRAAGLEVISAAYADSIGYVASLAYRLVGSRDGSLEPSKVRLYDRYAFPVSRRLDAITHRFLGKNIWVHARRAPVNS